MTNPGNGGDQPLGNEFVGVVGGDEQRLSLGDKEDSRLEDIEAAERDNEWRHAEISDDAALENAHRDTESHADEDGHDRGEHLECERVDAREKGVNGPFHDPVVQKGRGNDRDEAGAVSHGEVDAARHDDEHHAGGHDGNDRHLAQNVLDLIPRPIVGS